MPRSPTIPGPAGRPAADPMDDFLAAAAGQATNPRLRAWLIELAAAPIENAPTRPAPRKRVPAAVA